jgi:HdeA/HdeB family
LKRTPSFAPRAFTGQAARVRTALSSPIGQSPRDATTALAFASADDAFRALGEDSLDIEIGATRIARSCAVFGGLGDNMNRLLLVATVTAISTLSAAKADPVPLSTYADANGFIDAQTLTCGQLANTYQEDANALTSWYSGWYNGLAHKHFADFKKGREVEHQVIEYCKAHPDEKIIHAIGKMIKEDRAEGMMQEK